MATPKIVPIADGEGGLGTSSKGWGDSYFTGNLEIQSGGATTLSKIVMGTNSNKATIGVSGATDTFFTGTGQGDLILRADDNNDKIHLGAGTSGIAAMVVTEVANIGKVGIGTANPGVPLEVLDVTASSATQGGNLRLSADDGAVMGDNHRLGVIEFAGAEDAGGTISVGARIESICRDAWDGSNNDADLLFYTTDGTTQSLVLTLDADKNAIFAGDIQVGGGDITGPTDGDLNITSDGNIAFNIDADSDETSQSYAFKNHGSDILTVTEGGILEASGAIGGTNYRTIWVDAGSMVPSVTNGAQAGTEEVTNTFDFYAFDTTQAEGVEFKMAMPEQWDGGTIKAKFYFLPSSTNTGTVQFSIAGVVLDTGDIISTAMGTAAVHTALAGNGTDNDVHITAATAACTIAGSPSEGELVLFEIIRVTGTDTYTGDAHLLGVNIQYRETTTASSAW